ncbi:winged helix-turn-helix domain-containing protein [Spartinivicinus poritis]|uniref:Winged helix-turn-helix domain-containing protein n=1 Tax=Spartinivicinus poritis TaxID=2994640 RepID=A0ABT5UAQ0_9GAMM|nr:winged helix-turn-helix domain-containing protein [Spartinivicinus sp. A2-2]MDE1463382.1 winged helix-turn-helix domain-containing protein [Spartinivicinus sp. A2-2]
MKLLLIEDDQKISSYLVQGFQQSGDVIDVANNGNDGLILALEGDYDLLIVDVMLPSKDGLAIIAELRAKGCNVPVIILSAKHSVEDKVRGLETGSDDYMVKPFSFTELQARAQALLRRTQQATSSDNHFSELKMADLVLDPFRKVVTRNSKTIHLQPREFQLLEYLLRNPARVLSKTMILEHVWDYSFDPQTNVVDVLVCRLRSKIDKDFSVKLLHTLRGVGYVLRIDG